MRDETQIWKGKSGKEYPYFIKNINIRFNPNQNGNYIFCKLVSNQWIALYIGEGDLKERVDFRKSEGCVIQKGATHIHAHINNDNQNRLLEEEDLLNEHLEAYKPNGCNERRGG